MLLEDNSFKEMMKMSTPDLFKLIREKVEEVPPKIIRKYFEEEICLGNLKILFEKAAFENQKYLMGHIPKKKLKLMVEFCNFLYFQYFADFLSKLAKDEEQQKRDEIFRKFGELIDSEPIILKILKELDEKALVQLLWSLEDEKKILLICDCAVKLGKETEILAILQEKINLEKALQGEEVLEHDILYTILYQLEETKFVQFYEDCSKTVRIELLERIFAENEPTDMEKLVLQYKAKLALEKGASNGKITLTEILFLEYAERITEQ